MIWAVYRIHYGIDFIKQSVNSIINDVDKIFIFYSNDPWIKTDQIKYKNKLIKFPSNPENVESYLKENFSNDKIVIQNYECDTPLNQFGKLFNKTCKYMNTKPDYVLFIEPDMIFGENQLKNLKLELNIKFWLSALVAKQIEIWKYEISQNSKDAYRIALRKKRVGPTLWKISRNKKEIVTQFGGGALKKKNSFSSFVKILNMGFSFNKNTMLYKHLTAMVFSKIIGDSEPDENWYEEKWLNWEKSTKDLEISLGSQHLIKKAFRYTIPNKYYKFLIN
jgi:hypothetical protein